MARRVLRFVPGDAADLTPVDDERPGVRVGCAAELGHAALLSSCPMAVVQASHPEVAM
jgi:hypothetical protein